MTYAIVSDIHANCTALKATLEDAANCGATAVIVLGDVVGYGPDPAATLELVRAKANMVLMGNHDAAVAGLLDTRDFSDYSKEAAACHRRVLSESQLNYLASLPPVWRTGEGEDSFACTHADFVAPHKFYYLDSETAANENFNIRGEKILFIGHTHEPAVFVQDASGQTSRADAKDVNIEPGKRYIVNVGTCGYPRGRANGTYAVYDTERKLVFFRKIPFDLNDYSSRLRAAGMDEMELAAQIESYKRRKTTFACFAAAIGATLLASSAIMYAYLTSATGPGEPAPETVVRDNVVEKTKVVYSDGPAALHRHLALDGKTSKVRFKVKVQKGSPPATVGFWFEDANGKRLRKGLQGKTVKSRWTQKAVKVPEGAAKAVLDIAPREGGQKGLEVEGPEAAE